ncbi:MAG: efflux RND transporter periplasmic adaptor subunit [Proteobacteria bacterium]|jgi:RND family efflux transporter MFP subunit|nr:efflux RND transporter periplasmic adaptor subunit [Pseudomonadota bacterium]
MMKLSGKTVAVLVVLIALIGCQEEIPVKEMVRPVQAIQVGDPSDFAKRSFPGRAKATREVDMSFRVAGPLVKRPVNVGDEVRKGQELARIDPRDFQVNLRDAQGQLERVEAILKRAESDYERVVQIKKQDPGAVSQAMIDRNRQQVESTTAEIRSLQAAVASAKDKLAYTYLKAPFDGIVTSTYVENYEDVKAKQPVVRLIDHSQIEMIVNIPEDLIYQADYLKTAGKAFRVRFDPFPNRELKPQIKEIGKEASKTTRTYPVTLIMDQPEDIKILPGMAGKATRAAALPGEESRGDIIIPETAVFSVDEMDNTFVWIIDTQTKTVSKREVKTGELLDTGIAIEDGLKPGEWIATAGVHYLKEGQQVSILSQSSKGVSK